MQPLFLSQRLNAEKYLQLRMAVSFSRNQTHLPWSVINTSNWAEKWAVLYYCIHAVRRRKKILRHLFKNTKLHHHLQINTPARAQLQQIPLQTSSQRCEFSIQHSYKDNRKLKMFQLEQQTWAYLKINDPPWHEHTETRGIKGEREK